MTVAGLAMIMIGAADDDLADAKMIAERCGRASIQKEAVWAWVVEHIEKQMHETQNPA